LVAWDPERVGLDPMGLPVRGEGEHGRRHVGHADAAQVAEGGVVIETRVDGCTEDRWIPSSEIVRTSSGGSACPG
jgi:hypothetical protein